MLRLQLRLLEAERTPAARGRAQPVMGLPVAASGLTPSSALTGAGLVWTWLWLDSL